MRGKKLTFMFIKDSIEKIKGYKLISTSYINIQTKLLIMCENGHLFEMAFNNFMKGQRCPICNRNSRKNTYEKVKSKIESCGYVLLSHCYEKANKKLSIQCSKGHIFDMSYNSFCGGRRCPICAGNQRRKYLDVDCFIKSNGYTLLSTEYKNENIPLTMICPVGHNFKMPYNKFYRRGHRCPICSITTHCSTPEKEVQNYVKMIYDGKIENNDRKTIYNYWTKHWLELDIFIPELNKAIEYNSKYYHSFDNIKWKDMMKSRQCKYKGIELFIVEHDDWLHNKIGIMNKIREFILQ
jgi:hypothetical protein